jgi:urea carboxylase-associated protein 2
MGRILCSIIEDTVGWHDPIGGTSNSHSVEAKYGPSSYQEQRNHYHKNGRDSFLIEMGKWGLGPRDLIANVNFFSRIEVSESGSLSFAPRNSKAGDHVELRAEMNVLTILHTCQHPLDPNPKYEPKPVLVSIRQAQSPGPDDCCRRSRPENERGFTLTDRYFM